MNSIQLRRALSALAVCAALLPTASGCYWLRYREIAATHLEILERLAVDARDAYVSAEARLSPADISRLSYPLERARAFEKIVRKRRPNSGVLDALSSLSNHYAALVAYLDSVRGVPATDAARARVRELAAAVEVAAADLSARLESGES